MEMHDRFNIPVTGPLTLSHGFQAWRVLMKRSHSGELTRDESQAELHELLQMLRERVVPEDRDPLFTTLVHQFGFLGPDIEVDHDQA